MEILGVVILLTGIFWVHKQRVKLRNELQSNQTSRES